jgi:hypothetical protein
MFGCFEPFLVYGWRQNDNRNSIADEWLSDNGVTGYALEIIRNHVVKCVYGVACDMDETTGIPTVSEEAKNRRSDGPCQIRVRGEHRVFPRDGR